MPETYPTSRTEKILLVTLVIIVGLLCFGQVNADAQGSGGQVIANNTRNFVATAQDMGPEDTLEVIDVSVWLNVHNADQLDSLARDFYDPQSPNYRNWLTI